MLKKYQNSYFAVRHGQSIPNVKGIIVSDPIIGCDSSNGLTELGKSQAIDAAKTLLAKINELNNRDNIIIISSDFSRASRTAEIIKEEICKTFTNSVSIHYNTNLRERYFGTFEGTANTNYEAVWEVDKSNDTLLLSKSVELVTNVFSRGCSVIEDCENKYTNSYIILVSHGDVLQILLSGILLNNPKLHRSIEHLNVAEVRQFLK